MCDTIYSIDVFLFCCFILVCRRNIFSASILLSLAFEIIIFFLLKVSDDVDLEHISRLTDGFSGSDLRELCRNAALYRVRDYCKEESKMESQPER